MSEHQPPHDVDACPTDAFPHSTASPLDPRYTLDDTNLPDIPCIECRYNLRGLKADDRCPECGASIRDTLDIWALSVNGQQIPAVTDALVMLAWAPVLVAGLTLVCIAIGSISGFWGLGALGLIYGGVCVLGYVTAHFAFIASVEQAIGRDAHWNRLWYASLGGVAMLGMSALLNAQLIVAAMVLIGWLALHAWSAHMAAHLADRGRWDPERRQARVVTALSLGGAALFAFVVLLASVLGLASRSVMFELLGLTMFIMFPYGVLMSILHCAASIRLYRHLRQASKITEAFQPASTPHVVRTETSYRGAASLDAGSPFGPREFSTRLASPHMTGSPPLGKGI